MTTDPFELRPGRAGDAPAIAALLQRAFPGRFLLNSVYATPGGTNWLARQLAQPEDFPQLRVRVLATAGQLCAVTIAQSREGVVHLDYIAVDPQWSGRGLGSQLMADLAACVPGGTVTLDVFRGNAEVLRWYQGMDFIVVRHESYRVVDLTAVAAADDEASELDPRAAAEARQHAADWGFGPLTATVSGLPAELTLLGDQVVRVRSWPVSEFDGLATAVARQLPERTLLVLPLGSETDLPVAYYDELLRMEHRGDQ